VKCILSLTAVIAVLATLMIHAQDPKSPVAAQPKHAATESSKASPTELTLASGTKILLSLKEPISSANAQAGQSAKFGVLEEVKVGDVTVVPKGGLASATVTTAEHKKDFWHGGKLIVRIDYVQLADGEEAPVGAVLAGGHGLAEDDLNLVGVGEFVIKVPFEIVAGLFTNGREVTFKRGLTAEASVKEDIPLDIKRFLRPSVAPAAGTQPR